MKIKCTLVFKYRKFTAESDDDLQNMTEVEAVSDIFSAIGYMTEDVYAMEPKENEIKKHLKWKVEYGDMLVLSSDKIKDDDLAWSDRIRYVVYSIIKAEYKYQQTNSNTQQTALLQHPYVYQPHMHQIYPSVMRAYNPLGSLNILAQVAPSCQASFVDNMILMEQILDKDMFEEYKRRIFEQKKLEIIFAELENLEKHRKFCDKMKGGGKEKSGGAH